MLNDFRMPEGLALGSTDRGEEAISEDILLAFMEKEVVIRIQKEETEPSPTSRL